MARKLTLKEFIDRATAVHDAMYGYGNAVYTNSSTKITIVCKVHGCFTQQPSAHLNGQGCPTCSGRGNYKLPTFRKLVGIKHKGKYLYTFPNELHADTVLKIACPYHGEFKQRASSHLEGYGCKECAYDTKANSYEEFVARATAKHGNEYGYTKNLFNKRDPGIYANCSKHGPFTQNKGNHLQGHGCPQCYTPGFDKNKPGTLYYLEVVTVSGTLWKIGITNRTIDERFTAKDLLSITVVYQHTFKSGKDASDLEKLLLKEYKHLQYDGAKVLRDGNTELFTSDITLNDPMKS